MTNVYDIGDEIVLQGTFKNRAATLTDPTTVVCRITLPDGTETTPAAAEVSTGVWEAVYAPTQSGTHWYRFEGTGALKAAGEHTFTVAPQRVP